MSSLNQISLSIPPQYIDPAELNIDLNAHETLRQISQVVAPTLEMIDDTMLLCGSEAYVAVWLFTIT